ncbi:MAG: Arm DNA-binding domain-containing protein, partial [Azonexus sp.]
MAKLSDIQIRRWLKAGDPVAKSDGDGLTFTLSGNKTAAWVLRYRFGGKQREKTIGRYPDISLARAREIALNDRAQIQQGVNVAREKQVEKHEQMMAITVKALAADYEDKILPTLAASTGVSRRQKIRDYIIPAIGHLAVRDVTGADVVSLLDRAKVKSPKLVKEVLSVVKVVFDQAQGKRIISINPAAGISAVAIAGAEGKSNRTRIMLTDAEIKAVLPALSKANRTVEFVIRILLSTAVRI